MTKDFPIRGVLFNSALGIFGGNRPIIRKVSAIPIVGTKIILTENTQKRIFYVGMKFSISNTEKFLTFAPQVGGVFALQELSALFELSNKQLIWKAAKQFESEGLLTRYCRGVYVAKEFDPLILSAKVRPDSYVSFGSALAYRRLIGTESPLLVSSITPVKSVTFSGKVALSYSQISKDLYFGFEILENGTKMADAEKAFLDTLYFYQHKKTFYFNVFQDIDFSMLSADKINEYLEHYNNPKFKSFVRNTLNGKI